MASYEEQESCQSSSISSSTSSNSNSFGVEVTEPSMDSLISSPCFPLTLQFIDVSYCIKVSPLPSSESGLRCMLKAGRSRPEAVPDERTILGGITGMVSPGELLAVLGPSGSGKSTLLSVLAGRLQGKHSGAVLYNGRRPTKSLLRRSAFVTQDDVLHPHLTVRETLVFCAMLRLPRTVPTADKMAAADAVIAELGLRKCADTVVGGTFVRGVSGGERRRVSIGHEMLMNPSLLLLDEPTSGLDSTAASRLMETLSGLARGGRTVVASVHQPASRVYQMFDKVLLLSEGSCAYFGMAKDAMDHFGAAGFSPSFHVNPADFMLDLANGVTRTDCQRDADKSTVRHSLIFSYNRLLAPTVEACVSASVAREVSQTGKEERPCEREYKDCSRIGWFSQFSVLLHRGLKERRHDAFNPLRVFQVMAAAVLAGSLWWRSSMRDVADRLGLLFFISIFWGVFASFNAVFAFPQDRAIFIKERSAGMYSLSSYFMARTVADLPMELILPTLFAIVLYWMAGLRPEPAAFLLTLVVILSYVLVAQGLGLAMGGAIMDAKQASTMVTVTMLAFVLIGGFYVHNVPSCIAWMKYASFTFYCYKLLVGLQYRGDEMASFLGAVSGQPGSKTEAAEWATGGEVSAVVCVWALAAMFVGYRVLAYAALKRIKT